jgi:hypothetical protein
MTTLFKVKTSASFQKFRVRAQSPAESLLCSGKDSTKTGDLLDTDVDFDIPDYNTMKEHLAYVPGSKVMYDKRDWKLTPTLGADTMDCEWVKDSTNRAVFTIPHGRLQKALS